MAGSFFKPSEEATDGFRLIRLVKDGGTHVLRELLDSIHPAAKLPQVLKNNYAKLYRLKARHVIFPSQWDMLFHASGSPLDSKNFDITLLHLLLREICNLASPSTGWNNMPVDSDVSCEANVARIKYFRNELCHGVAIGVTKTEFEDKWKRISSALVALGLDQKDVDRLKSEPIDHDIERLENEVENWKLDIESRLEILEQKSKRDQSSIELSSSLPDKVPNVFGREEVIEEVKQDIQSGTVAAVVITGGPGFGKTTVAKEVAHELAIEKDRTVLFCTLRSKETFDEVATEMILHCGEIYSQLPNNPEQNLKQWSQQLNNLEEVKKNVTFVLDNADDVLESEDRQKFVSILKYMRTLSGQRVTFLITSRKFFRDPDLQMKETRMPYLSAENSKKVLTSRVSDQEILTTLSETDELAKLCKGVPLALHIVGRHLSYIKQDTLINSLKEKPLAILEEGDLSVKRAIEASFYLLSKREQETLVLLSLFPGSFDSEAAEAVIRATAEADYDIILLSLVKGPLVEKSGPYRYEIHPLIQHFLKIIGQSEPSRYLKLVDRAKRLACTHFMSRIAENAGMYWSKDKCKESIEAFNKDRNNFEYFLEIYVQGREIQDQIIVDICRAFMEDLPEKCLYLEMCVLPKFYTSFLERLLETFPLDHQPVHRVEILCLLGFESRKKGDSQKYKELMQEAEQIHSKKFTEFERNPLSKTLFCNSYAFFLLENNEDPHKERIQRETVETALKVSQEKFGDHQQTAVALKRAGLFEISLNERDEAVRLLKEALKIFQKCLGKHLLTAICLQDIADFYFQPNDNERLDICLKLYAEAIEMFEDLGMSGNRVTILTIKRFAICHIEKGDFDEAMNLLTKAAKVAELELEEDHTWKVLIKTGFAFLHDKMGNQQQAIDAMKDGLLMKERLGLPMDKLENYDKIQEFVERFPYEDFPGTAKIEGCLSPSPPLFIAKRKTDESPCIDKKRRKYK